MDAVPTYAAAGTLPDVFYGEFGRAMEWGYKGIVSDLNDLITQDLDPKECWFLPIVKDGRGRIFGIPGGIQLTTVFYRRDSFEEAGLSFPTEEWSITESIPVFQGTVPVE